MKKRIANLLLFLLALLLQTGCAPTSSEGEAAEIRFTLSPEMEALSTETDAKLSAEGLPTVDVLREYFGKRQNTLLWQAELPALPVEVKVYAAREDDPCSVGEYLLAEIFPDAELLSRREVPEKHWLSVQFSADGRLYAMFQDASEIRFRRSLFDDGKTKALLTAVEKRVGAPAQLEILSTDQCSYPFTEETPLSLWKELLPEVFPDAEILQTEEGEDLPGYPNCKIRFSTDESTAELYADQEFAAFTVALSDAELETRLADALARRSGLTWEKNPAPGLTVTDGEGDLFLCWLLDGCPIDSEAHYIGAEEFTCGPLMGGDEWNVRILRSLLLGEAAQTLRRDELIQPELAEETARLYYENYGLSSVAVITDVCLGYYYEDNALRPAYCCSGMLYRAPTYGYPERLWIDAQTGEVLRHPTGR